MIKNVSVSASLVRDGSNSVRILRRDWLRIHYYVLATADVGSPILQILLKWDLHEN